MNKLHELIRSNPSARKFFETADGRIVVGQSPNAVILGAGALWTVAQVTRGQQRRWALIGSHGLMVVWALLEMGWGVNDYRRMMGATVGSYEAISLAKLINDPYE